jgi:hypothetical protein
VRRGRLRRELRQRILRDPVGVPFEEALVPRAVPRSTLGYGYDIIDVQAKTRLAESFATGRSATFEITHGVVDLA